MRATSCAVVVWVDEVERGSPFAGVLVYSAPPDSCWGMRRCPPPPPGRYHVDANGSFMCSDDDCNTPLYRMPVALWNRIAIPAAFARLKDGE